MFVFACVGYLYSGDLNKQESDSHHCFKCFKFNFKWNWSLHCCCALLKKNKPFPTYTISLLPLYFLPFFLSIFRPRLVLMSPVKSLTSCDIPWNNVSVSCRRTTHAAAALWKSCLCCPHRPSVPDPASSPHRTSTALWLSLPHSQVTGHNTQWWKLIAH